MKRYPRFAQCLVVTALSSLAALSFTYSSKAQEPPADSAFLEQFAKGKAALKAHKYDDAIAAFKKANKLHHDACADCYYAMVGAYFRNHDPNRALESADKAISLSGDDGSRADAHNVKGDLLLALGQLDNKKLPLAEQEYRMATQLDKGSARFHLNLARALLKQSKDDEAKVELQACLDHKPDLSLARQASLMLADPRRGREEFAPEFQLTTLQGQEISLAQVAGKVVVFDFWATWCPPCRESVPELKALTKKYPNDKLVLISVSADSDEEAWREFVAKKNMDWAQYRDHDHKILEAFDVHAFPTYLVITGDGMIKQRIVGLNPQQTVVARLKETLNSMPQLEGVGHK